MRILSFLILASFAESLSAGYLNTVQVLNGPGFLVPEASSLSGSASFYMGFGPPMQGQTQFPTTSLTYSGSASADAAGLRAQMSMSLSSIFQSGTFLNPPNLGVSGAAIAEWSEAPTIRSTGVPSGFVALDFGVSGFGIGSLNVYGPGGFSFTTQLVPGSTVVYVPIDMDVPQQIRVRLIAGGIMLNPGQSFNSDYSHTVVLNGVSVTDSSQTPIPFSLTTASSGTFLDPFVTSANVPEPGTFALMGAGGLLLLLRRRSG
jgi:hypothetical protein